MRLSPWALCAITACTGASSAPDAPPIDAPIAIDVAPLVDRDHDGLDDAYESELAATHLPFISLDPDDGCTRSGLAVRVFKHPADPTKIAIIYDHLFETDCGLNGHTGDNEAFGVVIDPAIGVLAMRTASHQATVCERVTECTTCATDPRDACERQHGKPVLYASKGKHGQYTSKCSTFGTCLDTCTLATTPHVPPIVNVGEPGAPLVTNLTTQGFITAANGWTKAELMNLDPWGTVDFGGAGNIAEDLVDATFIPAPCD